MVNEGIGKRAKTNSFMFERTPWKYPVCLCDISPCATDCPEVIQARCEDVGMCLTNETIVVESKMAKEDLSQSVVKAYIKLLADAYSNVRPRETINDPEEFFSIVD